MSQNVLDVLLYLFLHYRAGEVTDPANRRMLHAELLGAGFPHDAVAHAFRGLAPHQGTHAH